MKPNQRQKYLKGLNENAIDLVTIVISTGLIMSLLTYTSFQKLSDNYLISIWIFYFLYKEKQARTGVYIKKIFFIINLIAERIFYIIYVLLPP